MEMIEKCQKIAKSLDIYELFTNFAHDLKRNI